ncbi:hypothetical protein MOMA_04535 [Moraxella macacae 0408225]|uniref:Uncharacterized protein n=1 Tax=Moraxella macacae 0408225 TaxID=1230338 RepID=L2FB30_9GAMM|nr:hypothetical protein [Moraxella macacae]ELA09643.1 hypothetical protein MOMA_04535 [Moraxella macacae 0408225]
MAYKKQVNHLASHQERIANLPIPFHDKVQHFQTLTQKIRQAWQAVLPDDALATLSVGYQAKQTLFISTNNQTLANHLSYSQAVLLNILQQSDRAFKDICQLKFQVIHPTFATSDTQTKCNQKVNSVTSCNISENTKQNIAHLAELVINDKALYDVLQKFLDQ